MRLFLITIILSRCFAFGHRASCRTEPVTSPLDDYDGCRVTLDTKIPKNSKLLIFSDVFDRYILTLVECEKFCTIYNTRLSRLNSASLFQRHLHSENESVSDINHSGSTNTIPLLGVHNGTIDITEAFGAFSDLILNFRFISKRGQRNIDLGGGQFDDTTAVLRSFGVRNFVYDIYGRSQKHNQHVLDNRPYDSATSISILNVITDDKVRFDHIRLVWDTVKCDGYAFFKTYEGDKSGTRNAFQMNQPTEYYRTEIEDVFGENNVLVDKFHRVLLARKKCSYFSH